MALTPAPDVSNYLIGKGNVYYQPDGSDEWRHVGNVPEFELTPEVEELDHFSSMAGVRTKDRTIVLETSMSLRMVMEEFVLENIAIAMLGLPETDSGGRQYVDIFSQTRVSGAIKLIGSNDVGPKFMWYLPKVDFIPSSGVSVITDEWGNLEVTGQVAKRDNATPFGRVYLLAAEGEAVTESVTELLDEEI